MHLKDSENRLNSQSWAVSTCVGTVAVVKGVQERVE
jgi:hypothetical protein